MNNEQHFGYTVTAGRSRTIMRIGTTCRTRCAEEHIRLTFVHIMPFIVIERFIDRQVQFDDTVTTGRHRSKRIHIDTSGPQVLTVEIKRQVVLTNLPCDDLASRRLHIDDAHVGTVVSILGQQGFDICAGLIDSLLEEGAIARAAYVIPCVWRFALANRYRILEQICRVNKQPQAVNTVATILTIEPISVAAGSGQ